MQTRPQPLRERLPAHPSSVGLARRLVRGAAAASGTTLPGDLLEDAELLISELVSNAILHAGTPVDVAISIETPTSLLVSVGDGSRRAPARRHYGTIAATGRGLRLLEHMSDDWGVSPRPHGKTVWFRLSTPDHPTHQPRPVPSGNGRPRTSPDAVTVELTNLPLHLHARWQQQAEALLREHLLLFADDTHALAQLEQHAQCSDAIALLAEAVATATEHHPPAGDHETWCPRVLMTVPHPSVPHFATLDHTMATALAEADTDQLLATPTDPDERSFRKWVCRHVADQAHGLPPTRWHTDQTDLARRNDAGEG